MQAREIQQQDGRYEHQSADIGVSLQDRVPKGRRQQCESGHDDHRCAPVRDEHSAQLTVEQREARHRRKGENVDDRQDVRQTAAAEDERPRQQ
jgi:hypothetical protein